ncbi:MAG: PilZ domain-containing protein [Proteobacteria bacterium]|nr:PilZ domain-containing protein [Pseudomonadota bacterium]
MAINERRKGARKNRQFAFQFKTMSDDGSNAHLVGGVLIDYSIAGIRFITGEQLEKNTALLIELDFDSFGNEKTDWRNLWEAGDDPYLKVIGSVMWCQENKHKAGEFEVGTRFVEKAPQA